MSIHLGDCLEKFGPSRAWWSFSMERLMGKILKASHNNRIGQLEITFTSNFCCIGNLQALLSQPQKFPPTLRTFIKQMQAHHDPIPVNSKLSPKGGLSFFNSTILRILIKRVNELFPTPDNTRWIASNDWAKLNKSQSLNFLRLSSDIENLLKYSVNDVVYATVENNTCNSIVKNKSHFNNVHYGLITRIFKHTQRFPNQDSIIDVWLAVHPLVQNTVLRKTPFSHLEDYYLQLDLRILEIERIYVIHFDEILADCAWIRYNTCEIRHDIAMETIALVCLDR
ncbi:hypothetical protein O181_107553 [Austropuccinia psidii MF-1]|uniref:Uncharacterized protein n=1 Tax=Austropuccinia psidii MF-1 TaxID=1389203 RepID=A0A9Q3JSP6_9BASI|nr:hypothetical protein [Austropuccinia psidii MF-1]